MKYLVLLQAGGSGSGSLDLVDHLDPKPGVPLLRQRRYRVPKDTAAVVGAIGRIFHKNQFLLLLAFDFIKNEYGNGLVCVDSSYTWIVLFIVFPCSSGDASTQGKWGRSLPASFSFSLPLSRLEVCAKIGGKQGAHICLFFQSQAEQNFFEKNKNVCNPAAFGFVTWV